MKRICAVCGWVGNVEDTHVIVEGEVKHYCPQCQKATFHFQASPETKAKRTELNAEWIGGVCDDDECTTCWQMAELTKPDYEQYEIPMGWTDETKRSCGHRGRGVSARLDDEAIPVSVSARSLTRMDVVEHQAWFHVGLATKRHGLMSGTEHHMVQTWDEAIQMAQTWYDEKSAEFMQAVGDYVRQCQETAKQKNYKPGWVWYRVKDKFSAEAANLFLSKAQ